MNFFCGFLRAKGAVFSWFKSYSREIRERREAQRESQRGWRGQGIFVGGIDNLTYTNEERVDIYRGVRWNLGLIPTMSQHIVELILNSSSCSTSFQKLLQCSATFQALSFPLLGSIFEQLFGNSNFSKSYIIKKFQMYSFYRFWSYLICSYGY